MKRSEIGKNERGTVAAEDGGDDFVEYGVDLFGDVYEVTVNVDDKSVTISVNGEEAALSIDQGNYLREVLARA